jgi:hypothetical protein
MSGYRMASVEKPDWLFLSTSARSVTVSRVTCGWEREKERE